MTHPRGGLTWELRRFLIEIGYYEHPRIKRQWTAKDRRRRREAIRQRRGRKRNRRKKTFVNVVAKIHDHCENDE